MGMSRQQLKKIKISVRLHQEITPQKLHPEELAYKNTCTDIETFIFM